MKNKIEVIDFLKGYSILSVVLYHFFQGIQLSPLLSKAINFGGTGIHIFFFASGFGLFFSHLQKPIGYRDFLKNRFTKIYIPYIIVVTLSALISLFIPIYENNWNNYFSHVFFYKMFDDHLIGTYGYQLWFISSIVQFYLLFPLIVKLREWIPGKTFLLVGLLISYTWVTIFLLLNKDGYRNWNSFFLMFIWEFMLGMYCAEMYLKNGYKFWDIPKSYLIGISIGGLGIYSLMAIMGGRFGKSFNDVPALFGYASLCIFIYSLKIKWFNRFIFFTARLSFSIFLIHFLILNLLLASCRALGITWSWFMLFPVLALCYLVALPLEKFSNYLIFALLARKKPILKTSEVKSTQTLSSNN
ncbi:MAG TPA: acyltransferase [Puia sp.]|nr:acyltransferase [Puia sp.]